MKIDVTIIAPGTSKLFTVDECNVTRDTRLKYITAMDNIDLIRAVLKESVQQRGVIVLDDVVYHYRENPLDDVNSRILTFTLALLKRYSERGLVIATSEPSGAEEIVIPAFKIMRFWADCVCDVEEENSSEFILKLMWTKEGIGKRFRVAFEEDGGMTWRTA